MYGGCCVVVFKQTYGFMLNRSRTATLALHSRLRLRSVKSFSLVQVMWTCSGPLSALSFIVAWDAVFLSWMSWAWKKGRDKGEEIRYYPGDISGGRHTEQNGRKGIKEVTPRMLRKEGTMRGWQGGDEVSESTKLPESQKKSINGEK